MTNFSKCLITQQSHCWIPCRWLGVGHDLAVEPVHGGQGLLVVGEVDEPVAGHLTRELVLDHLE